MDTKPTGDQYESVYTDSSASEKKKVCKSGKGSIDHFGRRRKTILKKNTMNQEY